MNMAIFSLSLRISDRFFVPRTFRNVVAARSFVDACAFSTLMMDIVASKMRA